MGAGTGSRAEGPVGRAPQAQVARTSPRHSERMGLGLWPAGGTRLPLISTKHWSEAPGQRSVLLQHATSIIFTAEDKGLQRSYSAEELSDVTLNPSHPLRTALAHPAWGLRSWIGDQHRSPCARHAHDKAATARAPRQVPSQPAPTRRRRLSEHTLQLAPGQRVHGSGSGGEVRPRGPPSCPHRATSHSGFTPSLLPTPAALGPPRS